MAIDIRATVTCSLGGTLISGSISDDYLQGTGLVKTRGSCEIKGLIRPAIGEEVTFNYVKGGVARTIPRKLRVMSYFADPFRRTTKVELGCKLTYLSDLRDSINWTAFDDIENNDYTEDDQRIITLPISAASIMYKCLEELNLSASSNPLTNKFSIGEFDFGAGYVQVLSDLLVSESYFGYLDVNETLQIISLDAQGGTGPVFTAEELVDVGPIGVGQLPGDAVTVSYSTLKLKQPDNPPEDPENPPEDPDGDTYDTRTQKRLWERSVTTAGPNFYYIANSVFTGYENTVTLTTYQTINGSDLPIERVTIETGSTAKIAGSVGTAYVVNGIGFNAITTELRKEIEVNTYDSLGNRIRTESTEYQQALAAFGGLSLAYVQSSTEFVSFDYFLIPTSKVVSTYNVIGNSEQQTSSNYVLWTSTIPGQQAVAEYRETLTDVEEIAEFVRKVIDAGLVHDRTIVSINTVGTSSSGSVVGSRPKDILNGSYADGGDPNNAWRTESTAELELALGDPTAQRRIEFTMPYAPDDIFSGPSGGPFTAIASDAPEKATLYGRVQNRLLLGNRNGINIQVTPQRMPAAPFDPIYISAEGLASVYRVNGAQWAFDSSGIVCSVDALYWGVAGTTA